MGHKVEFKKHEFSVEGVLVTLTINNLDAVATGMEGTGFKMIFAKNTETKIWKVSSYDSVGKNQWPYCVDFKAADLVCSYLNLLEGFASKVSSIA